MAKCTKASRFNVLPGQLDDWVYIDDTEYPPIELPATAVQPPLNREGSERFYDNYLRRNADIFGPEYCGFPLEPEHISVKLKGVYQLVLTGSDLVYTGHSVSIRARYYQHLNELKKGTHVNVKMQKHYSETPNCIVLLYHLPKLLPTYKDEQKAQDAVPFILQWNATRDVSPRSKRKYKK